MRHGRRHASPGTHPAPACRVSRPLAVNSTLMVFLKTGLPAGLSGPGLRDPVSRSCRCPGCNGCTGSPAEEPCLKCPPPCGINASVLLPSCFLKKRVPRRDGSGSSGHSGICPGTAARSRSGAGLPPGRIGRAAAAHAGSLRGRAFITVTAAALPLPARYFLCAGPR